MIGQKVNQPNARVYQKMLPHKMLINLNSWMTNIPLGLPEEGIENIPSLIFIELIKIHY